MKKFTLLLAAMFCAAGMANAAEELTLTRGWNCTIGTTEIGDIPQYPAEVTISGQWQNIKICTESFNATEWVSYKVVLAEPVEEGQIQVMVRNAAEAQAYSGTYQEIPAGVRFCTECGAKKPEAPLTKCPDCGYEFGDSVPNFCPNCGKNLK